MKQNPNLSNVLFIMLDSQSTFLRFAKKQKCVTFTYEKSQSVEIEPKWT